MYAKIANRKKKHKIFAKYFPTPATVLFVCLLYRLTVVFLRG